MRKKIKHLDEGPADYESTPVEPILSIGDLPNGWSVSPVRQIAQIIRGVSYSKNDAKETNNDGYIPILRATNIQDNGLVLDRDLVYVPKKYISEEQKLKIGDIVIATSSGSKHLVGKTAQVKADWSGSFGAFCAVLRPSTNVEPRYLGYFFNSPIYKSYISAKAMGVNINNLRRGDIEELHVPLASINEQKRIVAEIEKQFSRLDEAVANLKRVKANLKRYKAAVLKAAVEGRLVETEAELARREGRSYETGEQLLQRILETRRSQWAGRGKYKEPATPDATDLPELPDGWVWGSVEQIALLVTDGDHNPPKRASAGIPHLTAKHIREWRIEPSECTFISKDNAERVFKRYRPVAGDVIVTCVGTVGRTAIVPDEYVFSPDRNLAAIRLLPESVNTDYLQLALESPDYQKLLRGASGSTAQPHLYLTDLRALLVPIAPQPEQQRIVAEVDRRLSIIGEVETQVAVNLTRSEHMRQTILHKAFSGHLVDA